MNPSQESPPPYSPPYPPAEGAETPLYAFGPGAEWEPERPRRRPWRRTLVVAGLTSLVIAVAGAALGVLWHFVSPTVPVIDAGQNGIVVNDPSPEEYIASDGWFTLIGFAFGLVAAVVAWQVMRRDRGPALLLGVTVGALAAAPVAWEVGRQIGLGAYRHWRDTAIAGATYHAPPDLHAYGALLVPAFAAVIVMTLLAGWSNDPDLERPGAKPGYGRDLPLDAAEPPNPDPVAGAPVAGAPVAGAPVAGAPVASDAVHLRDAGASPSSGRTAGYPPSAGLPPDASAHRDGA